MFWNRHLHKQIEKLREENGRLERDIRGLKHQLYIKSCGITDKDINFSSHYYHQEGYVTAHGVHHIALSEAGTYQIHYTWDTMSNSARFFIGKIS